MKKTSFAFSHSVVIVILSLLLFLYSYTQVDLALTLPITLFGNKILSGLQYIGFYNRELSTWLYGLLLVGLFFFYFRFIGKIRRYSLSRTTFWKIVLVITGILIFSYPAFSYDIFNYMFTAKTVILYHKNPYTVIPLQFVGVDPWLAFMRWTHLPSAYTPLWILLSLPAYILGFGYFILILLNFKLLAAAFYLFTIYMIGRVLEVISPKHSLLGMSIFAFNPLIIVEVLINAHNDIQMMAFAMLAMYLSVRYKNSVVSFFALSISIALKFITIVLLPVYLFRWNRYLGLTLMVLSVALVGSQREILPWYLIWVVPFVALLPEDESIFIVLMGVTAGFLLRYMPYIYFGHWDYPVTVIREWATYVPILASIMAISIRGLPRRKNT